MVDNASAVFYYLCGEWVLNKADILNLLKKHSPEFLSGQEICNIMGVSRTAVWKHIKSLREEGYSIEAAPRSGYRLLGSPDYLYPQEIRHGLATKNIGKKIYYFKKTVSTNQEARKLASKGAPHGTLVVAEEQWEGKGRLGRGWFSPEKAGIWCTLVLRPEISPGEAPPVTMLAAVAVAVSVEKVTGIRLGIKWPNDLLYEGKKTCGILTEMSAEMDKVNYLLVGTGINVNLNLEDFPAELRDIATSLSIIKKAGISRQELIKQYLWEFEYYYNKWLDFGFEHILEEWKKRCVSLNRPVLVSTSKEAWEGWAEDVDSEGALILRLKDGSLKCFISGEVTLREK